MALVAVVGWGALVLLLAAVGDPPFLAGSDSAGWFTSTWLEDWGVLIGLASWATFLTQLLTSGLVEHWRLRLRGRTVRATVESVSVVEYEPVDQRETITARVRYQAPDGSIRHLDVDCLRAPAVGQVLSVRYLPDKPAANDRRNRSIVELLGLIFVESMVMLLLALSILYIGAVLALQLTTISR